MNLSIIGYGQMGRLIAQCATERGHSIVSIIDPFHDQATHKQVGPESMAGVEVAICFTMPKVALQNISDVCDQGIQLVMGTTGWSESMPEVRSMVEKAGCGMVYSSNFSIGVNLFFKMIAQAASLIDAFDLYDVMAWEAHHRHKQDSPSGTARTMGDILLANLSRKTKLAVEKLDRKIEPDELHFASIRGGSIPGTHAVIFDSEFDSIELKHTARSRMGFATGSIMAAEWIKGKKGLFTEEDMMNQILSRGKA